MKKQFNILLVLVVCLITTIPVYAQRDITPIADIQENFETWDGQAATIEGVVTIGDGLLFPGRTKFYIQDESGKGLQVYSGSALATEYLRGDKLQITGVVGKYGEDVQIEDPSVIYISSGNDLPVAYISSGIEDLIMNGTWSNAEGTINDIFVHSDFRKITIDVSGNDIALMFWNSTGADVSSYAIGDDVEAYGIISFYDGALQFTCGYDADISIAGAGPDTTPPTIISVNANSATEISVQFSEAVTSETAENINNYSVNGLTLSNPVLQTSGNIVSLTTTTQTAGNEYTLIVNNIEDENSNVINANSDFSFTGFEVNSDITPIADIQENFEIWDGQSATIEGVVTIGDGLLQSGMTKFYIQDESGKGIQIYNSDPLSTEYQRGDKLEITGTVGKYNTDVQIEAPVITYISSGNELPNAYTASGTEDLVMNGTWASAEGTINDIWVNTSSGFTKITINVSGNDIALMFWNTTGADVSSYALDDEVEAYGVISFFNNALQFTCGYDSDISLAGAGPDTTPPTITSVTANSLTEISVQFSEAVTSETADNINNYSVEGLTLSNPVLQTNGTVVKITTTDQIEDQAYTLTVSNVEDIAGNPIIANSSFNFTGYSDNVVITPIADIQENFETWDGQTATIEGVITIGDGLLYPGRTKFYIQDESGKGLQVYSGSALATEYQRGDKLQITGVVGKFGEDVQIEDPSVTYLSSENDLPTAFIASGNEDVIMNSTWSYAEGTINDIYVHADFTKITVGVSKNDIALMFWNSTGADVSSFAIGDDVEAYGVISFYEGALQFTCGYDTDISIAGEGPDTTPPTISLVTANSLTEISVQFSEAVTPETAENINNYSVEGLTLSSSDLQSNNKKVIITTSEQTAGQSYSIVVNNVEDTAGNVIAENTTENFNGYQEGDEYDSIAEIQDNIDTWDGQAVTIKGIVTIGVNVIQTGNTNAYVQDASGRGINIFDYDPITELARGNVVIISGIVDEYNGTTEITDPQVTIVDEPFTLNITSLDLADTDHTYLEGTLLKVEGFVYEMFSAGGGTNLNIEDEDGNTITIRIWDTTGIDLSEFSEGYELKALGVGSVYNDELQIVTGYQDQLTPASILSLSPVFPSGGDEVTVNYVYEEPVEKITLNYTVNDEEALNSIEMTTEDDSLYSVTLPIYPEGTDLHVYLTILDESGLTIYQPLGAPAEKEVIHYGYTRNIAKLNVEPKPFNPYAGETFDIGMEFRKNSKITLNLYDAEGKFIFTPINNVQINSESKIYKWDGRNHLRSLLPLGLYICYLEVIDISTGHKSTAKAPIVIGAPLK